MTDDKGEMIDHQRLSLARGRYTAASHAIQSAVAMQHAMGSKDGSPKHLRVGINLRAVDHAALVSLLIDGGIITREAYYEAVANQAEIEQADMERELGVKLA